MNLLSNHCSAFCQVAFATVLLFVSGVALASESLIVVSGYSLKNELSDVESPCSAEHLCMDSWFVHTIRVKETLRGDDLPRKKIRAVRLQHAQFIDRPKDLAIFILERIESDETRRLFDADYQIVDFSWPNVLYCFQRPLSELGLHTEEPGAYLYQEACYESPFEEE